MKARIDKSSWYRPKRMFDDLSHASQPLAASSKGGPFTERFTMKQRAPPIINIIEQPRSSSLIQFLNSYIESLSVLQKGDNVGFLSLRLSNLEILKTTLQNDKRISLQKYSNVLEIFQPAMEKHKKRLQSRSSTNIQLKNNTIKNIKKHRNRRNVTHFYHLIDFITRYQITFITR